MQPPKHYTYLEREEIEHPRGRNDGWWVTHTSYGKESIYNEGSPSPYLLPNEYIAGCIAQYLRLPVPPFAIMKLAKKDSPMFTSLQFTPGKEPPPDSIPRKCWENDPDLCTGIALFDMLIGNDDRRSDHIAVDNKNNPKEFIVYDHDCGVASDLLDYAKKRFREKTEDFLAENHCLIPEITTDEHFPNWIGKIQSIPKWFIEDVCLSAKTKGFDKHTARAATEFLSWRSNHIDFLIKKYQDKFTSISWEMIL